MTSGYAGGHVERPTYQQVRQRLVWLSQERRAAAWECVGTGLALAKAGACERGLPESATGCGHGCIWHGCMRTSWVLRQGHVVGYCDKDMLLTGMLEPFPITCALLLPQNAGPHQEDRTRRGEHCFISSCRRASSVRGCRLTRLRLLPPASIAPQVVQVEFDPTQLSYRDILQVGSDVGRSPLLAGCTPLRPGSPMRPPSPASHTIPLTDPCPCSCP